MGLSSLNRLTLTYSLPPRINKGSVPLEIRFQNCGLSDFHWNRKSIKRISLRIFFKCIHSRDFDIKPFLDFVFNCNAESPSLKLYMQIFVANASTKYKRDIKYQFPVFAPFVGFGQLCSPT